MAETHRRAPWLLLDRLDGETAMQWTERQMTACAAWDARYRIEQRSIGAVARLLAATEGREVGDSYFDAAIKNLYRRFPECQT